MMSQTTNQHIKADYLDHLEIGVALFYFLYRFFTTTTFFIPFPAKSERLFFAVLLVVTTARVYRLKLWQSRKLLLAVVLAGAYVAVYLTDRYFFLAFLAVLTIGFVNISAEKVLKGFSVLIGFSLLVTWISALGGAIQNFVFLKDGAVRSCLGICYPTDLASIVLFLVLFLWTGWKKVPNWLGLVLSLLSVAFARYVAKSSTSTICSILLACLISLLMVKQKLSLGNGLPDRLRKFLRFVIIFAFPFLAAIMFILMRMYAGNIGAAQIIDNLLSFRLKHAVDAVSNYGLKPFGTPFDQIGGGFSTFSAKDYNFVDSTYPLILIRYGWVLFSLLCIFWPLAVKGALENKNWRLVIAMTLLAVHSFSEHHFIEVNYNPLIVLLFGNMQAQEEGKSQECIGLKVILLGFLCCIGGAFNLPSMLSRMRTVVDIMGWYGGGRHAIKILGIVTIALLLTVLFLHVVFSLICKKNCSRIAVKKYLMIIAFCAVSGLAALWKCDRLIEHVAVRYQDIVEKDAPVLQKVLEAADGDVYVDYIPEIYRNEFPGIDASIWKGDDLSRLFNVTAVMDRQYDSSCFINRGFLFLPISDTHAIYTNDERLITCLQEQGFCFTGYYSIEKKVDLTWMAERNKLPLENERVVLHGPQHSMIYGPYLSLYEGPYTVSFRLSIGPEERKKSGPIGRLRVSAYYGQVILKEQSISADLFDERGTALIEIPFIIGSYKGIEFLAFLEDNHELIIEDIRYQRSPNYDIHAFYNRNRLKYREEYFDLKGNRIETAQGFSACEYGYNYDHRVNEIRYYDMNNQPVLITLGYASLKRDLNEKNQIVREEYFDVSGSRTLCANRYAINEREYDHEGNPVVQRFLDTDGHLVITNMGYAEVHRVFNKKKELVREEYYGLLGEKICLPLGYASTEIKRDVSGRPVSQAYFDALGNRVITSNGYAGVDREYNSRDQLVLESYQGTNGEPITLKQGYSAVRREYDERGNAAVLKYEDSQGNSVTLKNGYAELHREYNSRNWVSYESYYDEAGKPVLVLGGYAANSKEYDETGNAVVNIYYGLNGKRILTDWGYSEVRRTFDEKRQVVSEEYYGIQGEPILLPQEYHSVSYERDDAGNAIIWYFYGLDKKRCVRKEGYSELRREYNGNHEITKDTYYDLNGNAIVIPAGYAAVTYDRDASGNAVRQRFYGLKGEPVMTGWGYWEIRYIYDEKGKVIEQRFYDTDGNEVKKPE